MSIQWAILIIFLVCVLGLFAVRRVGFWAALTATYLVLNGIVLCFFPNFLRYEQTPGFILVRLQTYSAIAMLLLVPMILAVCASPKRFWSGCVEWIGIASVVNAVMVLVARYFDIVMPGNRGPSGFGYLVTFCDYAGQNGCYIAIGVGAVLGWEPKYRWPALVLCLSGIWFSASTLPWAVLGIVVGTYVAWNDWGRLWLTATWGAIATVCVVKYWIHPSRLPGRIDFYEAAFIEWHRLDDWWIGLGPRSFEFLSQLLFDKHGLTEHYNGKVLTYPWLHNDWLQLLFDYGPIGLVLVFGCFLIASNRFWKKDRVCFAMLMGLGGMAFWNYPVRYAWGAVVVMILAGVAFRDDRSSHCTVTKN